MIKINKIKWLSQNAKEAEVYLSDGKYNLLCFSHPFDQNSNNLLLIHTLNATDICKTDENVSIIKTDSSFGYSLVGEAIDVLKRQVKIGEFIIELDNPLPNDIKEGNYISFNCERIDIW